MKLNGTLYKSCVDCAARRSKCSKSDIIKKRVEALNPLKREVKRNNNRRKERRKKILIGDVGVQKKYLLMLAKDRATKYKLNFNLTLNDIDIPKKCPALGIPLKYSEKITNNTPTSDRIIPAHGYVIGNVAVISYRANVIKNNASFEEIYMVANWVKSKVDSKQIAS